MNNSRVLIFLHHKAIVKIAIVYYLTTQSEMLLYKMETGL